MGRQRRKAIAGGTLGTRERKVPAMVGSCPKMGHGCLSVPVGLWVPWEPPQRAARRSSAESLGGLEPQSPGWKQPRKSCSLGSSLGRGSSEPP